MRVGSLLAPSIALCLLAGCATEAPPAPESHVGAVPVPPAKPKLRVAVKPAKPKPDAPALAQPQTPAQPQASAQPPAPLPAGPQVGVMAEPLPAPPKPAPSPAIDPQALVGLDDKAILRRLGPPRAQRGEGAAVVWRYGPAGCGLDLHLFRELAGGGLHALAYRLDGPLPAVQACLAGRETAESPP